MTLSKKTTICALQPQLVAIPGGIAWVCWEIATDLLACCLVTHCHTLSSPPFVLVYRWFHGVWLHGHGFMGRSFMGHGFTSGGQKFLVCIRCSCMLNATPFTERGKGLVTLQPSSCRHSRNLMWPIRSMLFVDHIHCHGVQLRHCVFSILLPNRNGW